MTRKKGLKVFFLNTQTLTLWVAITLALGFFIVFIAIIARHECPIANPDEFTCKDMANAWVVQDLKYYASHNTIFVPAHIKDTCLTLAAPWLNKHAECVLQERVSRKRGEE